jgi:hypothetical protein
VGSSVLRCVLGQRERGFFSIRFRGGVSFGLEDGVWGKFIKRRSWSLTFRDKSLSCDCSRILDVYFLLCGEQLAREVKGLCTRAGCDVHRSFIKEWTRDRLLRSTRRGWGVYLSSKDVGASAR